MSDIQGFIHKKEPLLLPAGSVRATLALIVSITIVLLVFLHFSYKSFEDLAGVEVSVLGLYFGKRSALSGSSTHPSEDIIGKNFFIFDSTKPLGLRA